MTGVVKFDHDEARRLRAEGMTHSAIAEKLGVSASAVQRVVTPGTIEKRAAYERDWGHQGDRCECGNVIHRRTALRTGKCRECAMRDRRTSVRPDELFCFRCEEWKPDDEFPSDRNRPARRGKHNYCRKCQTEMKREYRRSRR